MYGDVMIRLREGKVVSGKLLDFTTIPIVDAEGEEKVIVYGILETESGDFLARQLSEIKRKHSTLWSKKSA